MPLGTHSVPTRAKNLVELKEKAEKIRARTTTKHSKQTQQPNKNPTRTKLTLSTLSGEEIQLAMTCKNLTGSTASSGESLEDLWM